MSAANARTRFQVRLTVTDVNFTPGLDLFGIAGSDPTADSVASVALPEHGLAVGADGSLWTCNGTAWAQLAGAGGQLGPVPTNQAFAIGDTDGFGSTIYDGTRWLLSCDGRTVGNGTFVQIQGGNTTAAGGDPGDILLVPGDNDTDGTVGDVRFMQGGVDMALAQWTEPAPYDESDDNILGMPLQRVYAVAGAGNVDLVLSYDCAVVSAVVYANGNAGATDTVQVIADPGGADTVLFTASIDPSGTTATVLPGPSGKVAAGTTIRIANNAGGEVNVLITVLAYRA